MAIKWTQLQATQLCSVDDNSNRQPYGVGSASNPVYFSNGIPVACSATVGNETTPVYLSKGVLVACTNVGESLFEEVTEW